MGMRKTKEGKEEERGRKTKEGERGCAVTRNKNKIASNTVIIKALYMRSCTSPSPSLPFPYGDQEGISPYGGS